MIETELPIYMPDEARCSHASCGAKLPIQAVTCVVCGQFAGYPNVRLADAQNEKEALQERLEKVVNSSKLNGSTKRLNEFKDELEKSNAVIVRTLDDLNWILGKDSLMFSTFHKALDGGYKNPEENEFDSARDRNDSLVNPNYYREIQYAALSLDTRGVEWYGGCHITLKAHAIECRSSVFEENGFMFNKNHPSNQKGICKPGYRATWPRRADLGVAKLGCKVEATTPSEDFRKLVVEPSNGSGDTDFIEVHIYGPLHHAAFEKVEFVDNGRAGDKALWEIVKAKLTDRGIETGR